MSEFNLIDESWIPVCLIDGTHCELGIRETLVRSKEIAWLEDQSPLVVASLHRLLLAVLYRALEGPTDIDQATMWFRNGYSRDRVARYLATWHERFWLFDAQFPFWQVPDFAPREWRPWTTLAAEHNADNAKVLFDHVGVELPGSVSRAAAARWLTAAQTFSVSAGKSELAHTGGAPSATAVMAIPLGRNLEDTLLLALVPQNIALAADDIPVWEREPDSVTQLTHGPARPAQGIADLYTWRTRAVRLRSDTEGISWLAFASGVGYERSIMRDPMVAYRINEKLGRLPMQLRERGLWRDFDSLLPDAADLAPDVVKHASALTRRDHERRPLAVMVFGQAANKAKIAFWRAERFTLPSGIASDGIARAQLRQLLSEAEQSESSLWRACKSCARDTLAHGTRPPTQGDISEFIGQMAVIPNYWSMLETQFHGVLEALHEEVEFEDVRRAWLVCIRAAVERAWQQHAASGSYDAWALRAIVRAEAEVTKELTRLRAEIDGLSVGEVVA